MDNTAFENGVADLQKSIDVCFERRLLLPSMVLQYSAIDILASLDAIDGNGSTRKNFLAWVNSFLLPGSPLKATAEDLYSSRCALVHAYSFDSDQTRRQKARQVYYWWGGANDLLADDLSTVQSGKAVNVRMEHLLDAFRKAVVGFRVALSADAERAQRVYSRASNQFYAHVAVQRSAT